MFHYLGGAFEAPDLADPRDIFPVPFDAELKVFVRVEPLCVDCELRHGIASCLGFDFPGHLLNLDNDKFRRF